MKTTLPKVKKLAVKDREWFLIDAEGQILGRLATRIAILLRGKHKPIFTPFLDTGDFVIIINAEKIGVTGHKSKLKTYERYSGYPGGLSSRTLAEVRKREPERIIRDAVKGMLPKGPLGRRLLTKLKICIGPENTHKAQKPKVLENLVRATRRKR